MFGSEFWNEIQLWQDSLSGIATLIAGGAAYFAVKKQIRSDRDLLVQQIESDRRLSNEERVHREKAFLTVIESSLETYRLDIEDFEQEVIQIRSGIGLGLNLKERLPNLFEASEFDVNLIEDWEKYRSFSIELISSIRRFYDAYRHQSRLLRALQTRVAPDVPLLRVVNSVDVASESLHSALGSLIVAVSNTRSCLDQLATEISKAKEGVAC